MALTPQDLIKKLNMKPAKYRDRLHHVFLSDAGRYVFDRHLVPAGWSQWDTQSDAHYFGIWVSKEHLATATYAEGDFYVMACRDEAEFREELESMEKTHGAPPPAFIVIDGDGNRTDYIAEREMGR